MPTRKHNQNTLRLGDWNTLCDVCGMKFKASDLRRRWDGFMVCVDDWEPEHPMNDFNPKFGSPHIDWQRGDDTEEGGTDVKGSTFPPTY